MTLTIYECPNECIVSPMPGECMQCDAVLVEAEYVPAAELAALSWVRWIPVSERLPEEAGLYLVTWQSKKGIRYVCEAAWEDNLREWWRGLARMESIVAWMPLPPAPESL